MGRLLRADSRVLASDLSDILPQPAETPFRRLHALTVAAFSIVGVFIVGFGVWATFAPLESAAIAGGAVEAETSRKIIQHLEGGIVERILVSDGDEVVARQPLIRLDNTRARTAVQVLQVQLWEAQANEARLLAERDGAPLVFPPDLRSAARSDADLAEIMAGQTKIFETRRRLQSSRVDVILQRKAQTEQEIAALRHQADAASKRAAIIRDELATVAPMVSSGLQTRARLLLLEREQAEIEGRIGETLAQISRAEQAIGESMAMILKLESDEQTEIAQALHTTQAGIFELLERSQAANDVLARTIVRAPVAGTVTNLRLHTRGGVVAAGEPLMELVPRQDRLIVLAQVKPEDIDLVRAGLDARVRLLAYKHRRVPPVEGVVTYVSADRVVDKATDQSFYLARVRIDEASLRALPDVEMMPGMPAEVMIKTGTFTIAHYVLRPLFESFNRAFRED
ncbi:HlyD family type I secretion periplasmic adaptor subunit [Arvimicrobium flavum]|uniref:HlyD family type I secretion periplasmic adaptor subunit n=1 Tax=Arvimicrobium flavum TaxID=3393320 RepID=UPI00237A7657|nr:HlyD family type I secretion periplasmic adaptor subunit [Mesorhizobium shangrilense]